MGPATASRGRILIVEDETHLACGLLFNLEAEGFAVELAGDAEQAAEMLASRPAFSALIVDVMLPGRSGLEFVEELRAARNYIPVLMLTARGRQEDVLEGFSLGADDYLPKPFELSILLARLNGLLRRHGWTQQAQAGGTESADSFRFAGRRIDFAALEVEAPGRTTRLTAMEADLLRYLVHNPGRIISRKELLEQVWRMHEDTDTRAIDNFIVRLRRYLEEEPARPVFVQTIRGVGYRFVPEGDADAGR